MNNFLEMKKLTAGESGEAREEFLRHLTKLVASAVKACTDAHGKVDPGSVGKRVAAQLWGETEPAAWNHDPAAWVKHVRGQLGMSQVAFAAALGTSQDLVSRWEHGRVQPGVEYQEKIRALARSTVPPPIS